MEANPTVTEAQRAIAREIVMTVAPQELQTFDTWWTAVSQGSVDFGRDKIRGSGFSPEVGALVLTPIIVASVQWLWDQALEYMAGRRGCRENAGGDHETIDIIREFNAKIVQEFSFDEAVARTIVEVTVREFQRTRIDLAP